MSTREFVMPKLGLTMTEGKLARWAVAPSAPFASGDVVAVVETDKIAYDVEAPAAGIMRDILVLEGAVAAVGTPLALWELEAECGPGANVPTTPARRAEPSARESTPSNGPPPHQRAHRDRVNSTPYARRLARAAGVDIGVIAPKAGNHSIKAANVLAYLSDHERAQPEPAIRLGTEQSDKPAMPSVDADTVGCLATEIDAGALKKILVELCDVMPAPHPQVLHVAILAAARALRDDKDPTGTGSRVGYMTDHGVALLPLEACYRISSLFAEIERAGSSASPPPCSGTLAIGTESDLRFVALPPPAGWAAYLAIGAMRQVFRPDHAGQPRACTETEITLAFRTSLLSIGEAKALLRRIRTLLENPVLLIAI